VSNLVTCASSCSEPTSAGILVIFGWRIFAKAALHLILPPIFRFFAKAIHLPNRRFYIPATDYKKMPSDFNSPGGGLRSIPSLIDLPGSRGVGVEVGGIGSGSGVGVGPEFRHGEIKLRGGNSNIEEKDKLSAREKSNGHVCVAEEEEETRDGKDGQPVKHYDADGECSLIYRQGCAEAIISVDSPDKGFCICWNCGACV
jgi:dihydrosphingosine 1-phosphate phosphatase